MTKIALVALYMLLLLGMYWAGDRARFALYWDLGAKLERSGFKVREAAPRAGALHLALEAPDLILPDLSPPDRSGLEL